MFFYVFLKMSLPLTVNLASFTCVSVIRISANTNIFRDPAGFVSSRFYCIQGNMPFFHSSLSSCNYEVLPGLLSESFIKVACSYCVCSPCRSAVNMWVTFLLCLQQLCQLCWTGSVCVAPVKYNETKNHELQKSFLRHFLSTILQQNA